MMDQAEAANPCVSVSAKDLQLVKRSHLVKRTYIAQAGAGQPVSLARSKSLFKIEIRFLGGLSSTQERAFELAADRWSRVIVGDLPSVVVDEQEIDDILIMVQSAELDRVDGILGQAGPTMLRPKGAGAHAYLPAMGEMTFDSVDLEQLESEGSLVDVITHEMGHVLGVGTIWARKRMLVGATTSNPTFRGKHARLEYGKLRGTSSTPVPVENLGGRGTRNSHWRESIFANELMSGFISAADNPLSALTVASLKDLGYQVDLSRAEPYHLPKLDRAASTQLARSELLQHRRMLPSTPIVLPDSALV